MEGLACTYILCLELRYGIERGESVFSIIKNSMADFKPELAQALRELIRHFEQHASTQNFKTSGLSIHRAALFQLIGAALSGEAVLKKLIELEKEMKWACEEEVEQFINSLSLKVMMPVLLLQFPAFLLLLLGPIVSQYLKEMAL